MQELLTPAGLGAIGGLLTIVLGGAWKLVERADKRAQARESEIKERIAKLEMKIEEMEKRENIYLRRIYQLEGVIKASGASPPDMIGWPP